MRIATTLDQIDLSSMAPPEYERCFVWNRDQVRGLMHPLHNKHSIGSLLIWETQTDNAHVPCDGHPHWGLPEGQERLTEAAAKRAQMQSGIAETPQFGAMK